MLVPGCRLVAKPQHVLAAIHFDAAFSLTAAGLAVGDAGAHEAAGFVVQFNHTASCRFGYYLCSNPALDVGLPVQLAVEAALLSEAARLSRGAGGASRCVPVVLALCVLAPPLVKV